MDGLSVDTVYDFNVHGIVLAGVGNSFKAGDAYLFNISCIILTVVGDDFKDDSAYDVSDAECLFHDRVGLQVFVNQGALPVQRNLSAHCLASHVQVQTN